MLAEIWLLWPFPLEWLWLLLILRGPETGLRRLAVRTSVNIAGFVMEGFNCEFSAVKLRRKMLTVHFAGLVVLTALGQRLWHTCAMRPHSRRRFAAAWRCQRLKQEQSSIACILTSG